jgi:hypothetical protein
MSKSRNTRDVRIELVHVCACVCVPWCILVNGGVSYLFEVCGYMPHYGYTRDKERCMYCVTRRLGRYYIVG